MYRFKKVVRLSTKTSYSQTANPIEINKTLKAPYLAKNTLSMFSNNVRKHVKFDHHLLLSCALIIRKCGLKRAVLEISPL